MTASPRLAFVGPTEAVSPWLLRAIGQSEAQFVAICEVDAARAERAAAEYHVRWPFHDLRTLLGEAQPQGVIIATPLPARDEVVRRCLAAGASILVLGMPVMPAGRPAVRRQAFVWSSAAVRFSPAGALARRMIDSHSMGELLSLTVSLTRARAARGVEEAAWPVSPDVIFEAVDAMEWLVGPAREVFARGHPDGGIVATLVSRQDIPVSLTVHEHGTPEYAGLTLELRGTDGTRLTLDRCLRLDCRSGTRVAATHAPAMGVSDPAVELGYAGLVREFVRRIGERAARAGASPDGPAAADAPWAEAVRTTQAIIEGLSRAGPVRLEKTARRRPTNLTSAPGNIA